MTTHEAFAYTIDGIDLDDLNALFFKPFVADYESKWHDKAVEMLLRQEHYYFHRLMMIDDKPKAVALQRMAFTVGIFVGVNLCGSYIYRYCYPSLKDAYEALKEWDGTGHPPGNWRKRKGEGGDLCNPNSEDQY